MDSIRFLGAAGTVTGSSYVIQKESGKGIMVDLGMFQGPFHIENLNRAPLDFSVPDIEGVILTHAHLDHCGRLPLLAQLGFSGKIYMTKPTRELIEIVLLDSAKISHSERDEPLYTEEDVQRILDMSTVVDYHAPFEIGGYGITMYDAGHILGSASVVINGAQKMVFSGDLGNSPEELLHATEKIAAADVVVMESTYGDRTHHVEDTDAMLLNEINAIEKNGGVLLIPAFSIERTQEILHKIDHLKRANKVLAKTPVYLDSPMAIKTTSVYKEFRNLYSPELVDHVKKDDPFDFPGLSLVESVEESKAILGVYGAKVIIAGSGMMSGGRIMYHALEYLSYRSSRLFIVGYQGEGTLGRDILDGARVVTIKGRKVQVNATVTHSSGMSAHADQPRLLNWFNSIESVKRLILTHGEDGPRTHLKQKINEDKTSLTIDTPHLNETISLT